MNLHLKLYNFSSLLINLTIVIIIGIAIVSFKNIETFSIYKVLKAFGYCFGGLFTMCLFFALPYDLWVIRKDKQMCDLIKIDYRISFLPLDENKKNLVREKFKTMSSNLNNQDIDWLKFE